MEGSVAQRHFRVPDGTRIAYRVLGPVDAPALVLCDGIACDGFAWTHMIDELASRYRILHSHHRGHGRSGLPRRLDDVTIPHLVEDIVALMQHVNMSEATFVGHSMGCQVTLEMAWRYPERVRAGVLLCGAHGRPLDTFRNSDVGYKVLPRIQDFIQRFGAQVTPALRWLVPTRLAYEVAAFSEIDRDRTPPEAMQGYLDHLSRLPHDAFLLTLRDAAERVSSHLWSAIEQPMLLMPAERDGFTPVHTTDPLREGLPNAEYTLIPSGTHVAPVEFPKFILRRFHRFAADHGLDRAAPDEASGNRPSLAARFRDAPRLVTGEA